MNNLVSIIVPVYNSENYIRDAIESVLSQDYNNIELIIVDDGSIDHSFDICSEYASLYSNIKLIQKQNGGVSSARNRGIQIASGEFICFLDSDDILDKKYISTLVRNMNDCDIVICSMRSLDLKIDFSVTAKEVVFKDIYETVNDFSRLYINGFYNSPVNKIYRKNKITNIFPEDMSLGEDLVFNCSYLCNCGRIKLIPDILYYYRMDVLNSLTKTINSRFVYCWMKILDGFNSLFAKNEIVNNFMYYDFLRTFNYEVLKIVSISSKTIFKKRIHEILEFPIDEVVLNYSRKVDFKNKIVFNLILKRKYFVLKMISLFKMRAR